MKYFHLSDLHIGKRLLERSLLEDQKHVLEQILKAAEEEHPDAALIAGDVYDRAVPSAEAVEAMDAFLVALKERIPGIFIISGNHDSAERLAFGRRLMSDSGVYIASAFDGRIQKAGMEDSYGRVNIWMLPFVKPSQVQVYYEDIDRDSYTDAIRKLVEEAEVDRSERNILIAHQYVTDAQRSDSEESVIGGLENVDSDVFGCFDYTALGHLHKIQKAGSERIYYCGAPMAYSFAEAKDRKSFIIAEMDGEGRVDVKERELLPLRPMEIRRGSFDELMNRAAKETEEERECYLRAELSDEEYVPDAIRRLRTVYPNILEVAYPGIRGGAACPEEGDSAHRESPLDYLEEFFRQMRGREMSSEQRRFAEEMIRETWEETE